MDGMSLLLLLAIFGIPLAGVLVWMAVKGAPSGSAGKLALLAIAIGPGVAFVLIVIASLSLSRD